MTPILSPLGVVQATLNGIPVTWNDGLGYTATGRLCVTTTTAATDVRIAGRRMTRQGLLVVAASTLGGQPWAYNAGWPFDKLTGATIAQVNVPAANDPRVAGVAIGPRGGVYLSEGV